MTRGPRPAAPSNPRRGRTLTALASILAVVVAAVVPAAHLVVSLPYEAGILEATAANIAARVSEVAGSSPDTWQFQRHRLEVLLDPSPHHERARTFTIEDPNGQRLLETSTPVRGPTIVRRADIFESGVRVGAVEARLSVRPLLITTGWFALLGLGLGFVVFMIIRVLPLRALAQSEEDLRSVTQTAMDGIVLVDGAGRITYWNDSARAIFGYGGSADVPGTFESLLAEGSLAIYRGRLAQDSGAHGAASASLDLLAVRRDGGQVPIELSLSAWQRGGDTRYLHVMRDVTERRRAEQEIRGLAERYQLLFDKNPQPMCVIDLATLGFLAANEAAVAHYGFSRDEFLAMTLREIRPPEDVPAVEAYLGQVPQGRRNAGVWRHRKKDGTLIEVEVTSDTIVFDGRPALLVGFDDVTERRRSEAELERQREAAVLQEKLAAMGSLLAGVAHELNNPLSVVLGNTSILAEQTAGGPLAKRCERIVQAAQRCARIVKNFLALARHQARKTEEVDVNTIVREAVELLAYPLRVDDVAVTYDLAEGIATVWGDAHELSQVVVNLVVNAHQAMREVPGARRLALCSQLDATRERVVLRVSDSGPGIPPEIQARIFEPLFTTKPLGQGTGLGLSICRAIVERHGGSIAVDSSPGRGATFTIEIPFGAPPAVRPAGLTGAGAVEASRAILIVDDEPEVASLIAELLEADGHTVTIAGNGAAALALVRAGDYDVIISDVRMPEMDGPGLYREVQRIRPELCRRFIFATGDGLATDTRDFLEEIGAPTVPKPFTLEELQRAIGQAVAATGDDAELTERNRERA